MDVSIKKLNLGGGDLHLDGFINVDLSDSADLKHDLRTPLPFEDNSIDEIIAIHVIESFYQWEFPDILKDWHRVLKPQCALTIEFTVLSKAIDLYLHGKTDKLKRDGHWGLYGNQEQPCDPIILHHYVYETDELNDLLVIAGFRYFLSNDRTVIHHRLRDLRITCFKE